MECLIFFKSPSEMSMRRLCFSSTLPAKHSSSAFSTSIFTTPAAAGGSFGGERALTGEGEDREDRAMYGERGGVFERRELENLVALEDGVRLLYFRWLLLRLLPLDELLFFDLSLETSLAFPLTALSAVAKGFAAT